MTVDPAILTGLRPHRAMHAATVNGDPGVLFVAGGSVVQVVSLCIGEGVRAVYMTLNPDKLIRWSAAEVE
ncbi:MAG TPA: hypothetical protein VH575_03555 [Gemmataceae bacterium]|jgi:RNA polymerase sigma-70 factor (ECF subfamily)